MGRRLAAYYWHRDWQTTCLKLSALSSQIRQAIAKLDERADDRDAATEQLNAFKDTCVWAGVRLPESDSCTLAAEVLRVWQSLTHGQKPTSGCRLNSAWTKLYALALPDKCVIYDSRVAAAVTSILDPTMEFLSEYPNWQPYANLGDSPRAWWVAPPRCALEMAQRIPPVAEPDGCKSLVPRSVRRTQPTGENTTRSSENERSQSLDASRGGSRVVHGRVLMTCSLTSGIDQSRLALRKDHTASGHLRMSASSEGSSAACTSEAER